MQRMHARAIYLGTAAERSALSLPGDGQGATFFDTENGSIWYWDGTAWLTGSSKSAIRTITASDAATVSDGTLLCDCSLGDIIVTLPPVASSAQLWLKIKKIDGSAFIVTIDGYGAELIDGDATQVILRQWTAVELHCDGSAWYQF